MTKAQMQAVVLAATNAGFDCHEHTADAGVTWTVRVTSGSFSIKVSDANALAAAQGVSCNAAELELT